MRRDDGFTLLELLVVMSIMALIAALALPNLRLPGFASDAARAAREIASSLADARHRAIRTNRESAFVVDLAARSYRLGMEAPVVLPGIKAMHLKTVERDVVDGARGLIRFFPDGSSDGGELAVTDGNGVTATIHVNWLTGRIVYDR